jgi:hypothetical protein
MSALVMARNDLCFVMRFRLEIKIYAELNCSPAAKKLSGIKIALKRVSVLRLSLKNT